MNKVIDKKTLEKTAELARIEINEEKEEKLLSDLKSILNYFEELRNVDVSDIKPMAGATELTNVFRDDEPVKSETAAVDLTDSFPEKENGFLKVPAVFE